MFPKIMRYASLALALVCVAMTAADFWNLATPALKEAFALGIPCTAASFGLAKLWKLAETSV